MCQTLLLGHDFNFKQNPAKPKDLLKITTTNTIGTSRRLRLSLSVSLLL